MYRLIIDAVEPLNAQFCEALVAVLGGCEVIPLTENYCAVEGFKMECTESGFQCLLAFIEKHANSAFLGNIKGSVNDQVLLMQKSIGNALICDFEPPKILLHEVVGINSKTWLILGICCNDF